VKLPFDLRAIADGLLARYRGYSESERRIILALGVAIVASVVYVFVIGPIVDYRKSIEQEIADGQEELERDMRFLSKKDTLRTERDDLRRRLTQAKGRLLPGGTQTLGAAALQERTNNLANDQGISIQSTQVMQPSKDEQVDPFRKVAVRLTLSGELKPLAEFLSALEYGQQQLSVPFVEVSRRGAVAGAKGPRTLSVTMEVGGFVQAGAKTGEGPAKTEAAEGEQTAAADTATEGGQAGAEGAPGAPATAVPDPNAPTSTAAPTSTSVTTSTVAAPGATPPTTQAQGTTPTTVGTAPTTAPPSRAVAPPSVPPTVVRPPTPPPPPSSDPDESDGDLGGD
jgi:type II secretory pathway component PulM